MARKKKELRGDRKAALDAAKQLGHRMSRFKPTKSDKEKHVAHCHDCGALAMVYDYVPQGDQIAGAALRITCPGPAQGGL